MTNANIDTILFDLDGTLVDSKHFLVRAADHVIQKYAPGAISFQTLNETFGTAFANQIAHWDPEIRKEAGIYFTNLKLRQYAHHIRPFPYVAEGLQRLKASGFRLGIVTNQQRDVALQGIGTLFPSDLFDVLVALEQVQSAKPAPDAVYFAMSQLESEPGGTVMVGDSIYDIECAARAGIRSVLLDYEGIRKEFSVQPSFRFFDFASFVLAMIQMNEERMCDA